MAKDSTLLVLHFRTWKKDVVFICHVLDSDFTLHSSGQAGWNYFCHWPCVWAVNWPLSCPGCHPPVLYDLSRLEMVPVLGPGFCQCVFWPIVVCVFRWCSRLMLKAIVTTLWPYCSVRTPTPPQLWWQTFPTDASHIHTPLKQWPPLGWRSFTSVSL